MIPLSLKVHFYMFCFFVKDMATGGHLEYTKVPDIYSCPVCLEHLLDCNPRFLSCHHYFCQQCLQGMNERGVVTCPKCRKATTVGNNDVTELALNSSLVESMKREQFLKEIIETQQGNQPELENSERDGEREERQRQQRENIPGEVTLKGNME